MDVFNFAVYQTQFAGREIIDSLVIRETSRYRPTQNRSIITRRPVGWQLRMDYIPALMHHCPLTYTLWLRDQQEPPSKPIHVSASDANPGVGVDASPWDLLDGISQTIFSPCCSHRVDSPAGSLGRRLCFQDQTLTSIFAYRSSWSPFPSANAAGRGCKMLRFA